MTAGCVAATPWAAVVAALWLAHAVFEYWLGKTAKVRSASTVELIITGVAMLAVLLMRGKLHGNRTKAG